MCGIAGIWNLDGARLAAGAIDRFTDSLAHRGPDGRGTWCEHDGSIALGHRRLAILDLSDDGRQPMSYAGDRYYITYNGEVYNFIEIRNDLERLGHVFRSSSDTEVILAAYQHWGEDMLVRFNGMWAFVIYDRQDRTLFMARDRFGIKPFHYRLTSRQFAFASELKAFKHLDGYAPAIDHESARVFLQNGFGIEGTSRTMLSGVRRLQGGHCALLRDGQLSIRRWWNTLDHLIEPSAALESQAEEFRAIFDDAVKLRMRSDVQIGSCLSGGFDSTSIVCTMATISGEFSSRQARDWQQTFIATFPGAFNDERTEAEEVVRHTGVKGNFFPVTDSEALQGIDLVLHDFDDVYIGLPTAAWLIYRELRRAGVVVSLDGHGADELMGGYVQPDYLLFHDAPSLFSSPGTNLRLVQQYRETLQRFAGVGSRGGFHSPLMALLLNHPSMGGALQRISPLMQIIRFLRRNVASATFVRDCRLPEGDDFQPIGAKDVLPPGWGEMNRKLYRMFHSDVLPTILRNFDRLSMAHGVEVRMPFMDWRLVRYVFSLPESSKIGAGFTKRVAREAMKGRIPESIRTARHKIGFNSPMPEWFQGPLNSWILEIAGSRTTREHDLIDGERFSKAATSLCREGTWDWRNAGSIWPVLHYLWFEKRFLQG